MPAKKKTVRKKKAKLVKSVKQDDPLFVGLPESDNIRRHILESSKESLLILKKLEEIKDIRQQKLDSTEVLLSLMSEIKSLLVKLRKKVPAKVAKRVAEEQKSEIVEVKAAVKKAPVKKKAVSKRPMTELEKLEAELAAIESKLGQ